MKNRKDYFYYILDVNENDELVFERYDKAKTALIVAGHRWQDKTPEQRAKYSNYDEKGQEKTAKKIIFAVVSSDYNWIEEPDKAFDVEGVIKDWSDFWLQKAHWKMIGLTHRSVKRPII